MRLEFMGYMTTPYIIGEEKLEVKERVMEHATSEGTYFIRRTNIEGIFTYGFEQNKPDFMGHSAGYVWSSRCGVMNKVFDTALIEINYKKEGAPSYQSCAINLADLENILTNTEWKVDWTPRETDTDVSYHVVKTE